MSYFSEEENDIIYSDDENNEGDEGELSSDESIDIETKNIFYKANYNNTYELDEDKNINNNKVKKPQIKSSLSLQDFVKKIELDKPKKFVSKRVSDRKPVIITKKRSFNPRLPPYNFVNKNNTNKKIDFNDDDFPSLN